MGSKLVAHVVGMRYSGEIEMTKFSKFLHFTLQTEYVHRIIVTKIK